MPVLNIRPMAIADHERVLELFRFLPEGSVREADGFAGVCRYLARNPGLSFVAEADGGIVACVLCGHDGRRGYLQHLVVADDYRRRGIARRLVERCITELAALGIHKTHIDVFTDNRDAQAFWSRLGWQRREELFRYSFISSGNPDA